MSKTLTWWDGSRMASVQDPSYARLYSAAVATPPGSIFVCAGSTAMSEIVGWYSMLRHPIFVWKHGLSIAYSHCGVFIGRDFGAPDAMVQAMPQGVYITSIMQRLTSDNAVTVWTSSAMSTDRLVKMESFLKKAVGKPYDWLMDISFVIPIGDEAGAYNCVQVALDAAKDAGLFPYGVSPGKITPVDLARLLDSDVAKGFGWHRQLIWE